MSVSHSSDAERWMPVREFEGIYEASTFGRVRRTIPAYGNLRPAGHFLTPSRQRPNSYLRLCLTTAVPGVCVTRLHHRVIYEAFNGPIPKGLQINHVDGDKANNVLSNLEIVTPRENIHHSIANGFSKYASGEAHGHTTLTAEQVIAIRMAPDGAGYCQRFAKIYGVCRATILNIRRHKTWKHV